MVEWNNAKRTEELMDYSTKAKKISKKKVPVKEEDAMDTNFSNDDFQVIMGNSPMIPSQGEKFTYLVSGNSRPTLIPTKGLRRKKSTKL